MSRTGWKRAERDAASLLHGARYPANTGGLIDVESAQYVAQVKARRTLSLRQLESLVLELERQGQGRQKAGFVMMKRAGGRGRPTPWIVAMTGGVFRELIGVAADTLAPPPHSRP